MEVPLREVGPEAALRRQMVLAGAVGLPELFRDPKLPTDLVCHRRFAAPDR